MKKLTLVAVLMAVLILALSCGDDSGMESSDESAGITLENAFYYTHVNGHKEETETPAVVLFEYEMLEYVKYQVAYIACTCRGPEVNYWSVMYVEISKEDGSIRDISWAKDGTGHYTAGMYGDSVETYEGVPARRLLTQYVRDHIMGKSQDYIIGLESMHGDVDEYTGATVTPNNVVRTLQGLFGYHNERYM